VGRPVETDQFDALFSGDKIIFTAIMIITKLLAESAMALPSQNFNCYKSQRLTAFKTV
jgi:hypothetical protein